MSKGLEVLEKLTKAFNTMAFCVNDNYPLASGFITKESHANMLDVMDKRNTYIDIIKKELKAFEIIKEKQIDVLYIALFPNDLDKYNKHVSFIKHSKWCLTQEEYDLLKEVLL